jgi:D-arabinose 1-dehydrogenase-like Zn-dependent alcohol dehydrogenase
LRFHEYFPSTHFLRGEAMPKMKAVQISKPGGNFELVERNIPEPARNQVRIKVEACGICHSDALVKEGYWPGIQYPRVPGHEIAGRIDAVGADITNWKPGQRVGVGWHGGHDFTCDDCRRGDFINCRAQKITAISYDGGYAEYLVVPAEAVAAIPDELTAPEAAPLLCAGITVFNALRNSGARAGDRVAVQGIGGLGHLGIQYARQMGFRTFAIGRGKDKEALARKLGAAHYVDTAAGDPAAELQKFGGAHVILATAPDSKAMSALVNGLSPNGKLLVVGASGDPITVTPIQLISGSKTIQGWASGTAKDSEETMQFSALSGVRPMIEKFPLEKAAEAYEQMISGKARFRVVLTMGA